MSGVVLEDDKKPVAEKSNTINIMVKSNVDQTEVWFRIKRDAQMNQSTLIHHGILYSLETSTN
ncbi:hypothetical protein MKX01_040328 [Papaver californicum]|nr:hypothetical protein MKX01_040328 [Papaver californicum]